VSKSKKEAEAFEEWKAEIAATLTGPQLDAFNTLMSDEAKGKTIFRGHIREQEFYTRLNELDSAKKALEADMGNFKAEKDAMYNWYKAESPKNAQLIEEKQKLAARLSAAKQQLIDLGLVEEAEQLGVSMPAGTPASSPIQHDDTSRKELEALRNRLEMFDKALPALMASYGGVIAETVTGKWNVNPADILSYAVQNGVDPRQAFWDLTAEQREERAKKQRDEEIAKAKEEGRREALTQKASPDFFRAPIPGSVDALKATNVPLDRNARVGAAVSAFLDEANR